MDNQPVGPDFTVKFPFDLSGGGQGIGELAEIKGNSIEFLQGSKKRRDCLLQRAERIWYRCEGL